MKLHLLPILLLAATGTLQAGTGGKAPVPMTTAAEESWWFRAAPYVWLSGIDGDVGIGPLSAPVDISISDTLDSLDMAFMGVFEVGKGRWSAGVDVIYGKLSSDLEGGGHVFDSYRFQFKQWILTPFVAYRAVETPDYHMDVFAGARITILESDLTGRLVGPGEITASRDLDYVDPIIGVRGQAELTDKVFFRYNADIGGFGASSDLVWQAFAGFGYRVTDSISVAAGYRGLGMDYSKGSFFMDTVTHGPVLGLEMRF